MWLIRHSTLQVCRQRQDTSTDAYGKIMQEHCFVNEKMSIASENRDMTSLEMTMKTVLGNL